MTVTLLAGCATESEARPVVVQFILVGNRSMQEGTVDWASNGDDETGPVLPADQVHLWVLTPDGDSIPVIRSSTTSAATVALRALPGAIYRLTGTIAGVAVTASTTIPGPLLLTHSVLPDTAVLGIGDSLIYRWQAHADRSVGMLLGASTTDGAVEYSPSGPPDSLNVVTISGGFRGGPFLLRQFFLAADANCWTFYTDQSVKSTISGAYGLFGSGAIDSLRITLVAR